MWPTCVRMHWGRMHCLEINYIKRQDSSLCDQPALICVASGCTLVWCKVLYSIVLYSSSSCDQPVSGCTGAGCTLCRPLANIVFAKEDKCDLILEGQLLTCRLWGQVVLKVKRARNSVGRRVTMPMLMPNSDNSVQGKPPSTGIEEEVWCRQRCKSCSNGTHTGITQIQIHKYKNTNCQVYWFGHLITILCFTLYARF